MTDTTDTQTELEPYPNWERYDFSTQTIGQLGEFVTRIAESGDVREATRYHVAYSRYLTEKGNDPSVASSNIGYVAGYYSRETMAKVHEVFNVGHPVFGKVES